MATANVTISLTFTSTSSGYSWSLSSSDTSIATISSDGHSYIINGVTYTPNLSVSSSIDHYKITSYTFPKGSAVGTTYPSSTTTYTPTDGDFQSPDHYYYNQATKYDYHTTEIHMYFNDGSVYGDKTFCSYTVNKTTTSTTTYSFKTVGTPVSSISAQRKTLLFHAAGTTEYTYSRAYYSGNTSGSTAVSIGYYNSTYKETFDMRFTMDTSTGKVTNTGDVAYYTYKDYSTVTQTLKKYELSDLASYTTQSTTTTSTTYDSLSVTWNSSIKYDGNYYYQYGQEEVITNNSNITSHTLSYRRTIYYYPIWITICFSFNSKTGEVTWTSSETGEQTGNTTIINKIKSNTVINKTAVYVTTHSGTTWNFDTSTQPSWKYVDASGNVQECNCEIVSSTKTALSLCIPKIIFVDKNGTSTQIKTLK